MRNSINFKQMDAKKKPKLSADGRDFIKQMWIRAREIYDEKRFRDKSECIAHIKAKDYDISDFTLDQLLQFKLTRKPNPYFLAALIDGLGVTADHFLFGRPDTTEDRIVHDALKTAKEIERSGKEVIGKLIELSGRTAKQLKDPDKQQYLYAEIRRIIESHKDKNDK